MTNHLIGFTFICWFLRVGFLSKFNNLIISLLITTSIQLNLQEDQGSVVSDSGSISKLNSFSKSLI